MPSTANPPPRILITAEDPAQAKLLESFLTDVDCETSVSTDVQDTLAKAIDSRPKLILLALTKSDSKNLDVCRRVKSDPATVAILVLVVIPLSELSDIEHVVGAGADDFSSKPVNKAELLRRVINMLGQ